MFTNSLTLALWLIAQGSDAESSFDDLGYLLFGGLAAAIGVAAVVAFLKLKSQDRKSDSTDFVSINPSRHEDRS
jgi:DNA-binding transcriptional regulator of glucitol operon